MLDANIGSATPTTASAPAAATSSTATADRAAGTPPAAIARTTPAAARTLEIRRAAIAEACLTPLGEVLGLGAIARIEGVTARPALRLGLRAEIGLLGRTLLSVLVKSDQHQACLSPLP